MSNHKNLPAGWIEATIPELIGADGLFVDGDWVESKDQDPNGDVRLVQLADIGDGYFVNKSNRFLTKNKAVDLGCTLLKKGDVLVARMPDPLGRACIFPGDVRDSVTVVDVCVVRSSVSDNFDHRWLMHFVNAPEFRERIHSLQSGSTRKRISRGNLSTLPLPIPPRKEQIRIVEKLEELLSDLDAGVAELKAAQKKLAQYRQSLLKAAVEGELTAEWRRKAPLTPIPSPAGRGEQEKPLALGERGWGEGESGAQLLERILKERRARWEEKQLARFREQGKTPPKGWRDKYPEPVPPDTANLPELPEGWVWSSIGECFRVAVGATPSRKEPTYWNGSIPWVSSGEVQFSRITVTKETITEEGLNNSSTQINPVGSVLLGMIGEGKTRGQVAILDIEAANNQNCAAILGSETDVPSEYVYYWLWSQYEQTRRGSSGNNQPAMNKSIVERLLFPMAPLEEMKEIVRLVEFALNLATEQSTAIKYSLAQAAAQRKNILKAAFSGQLVPQDPADEPASVLLERIRAERATRKGTTSLRGRKRKETD